MPDPGVTILKDCIEDTPQVRTDRAVAIPAGLPGHRARSPGTWAARVHDLGQPAPAALRLVEEQQETFFTEVGQPYTFPEPGAVLYDFYTAPSSRGRGYYRQNLCHILRELAASGTGKPAFVCVLADNTPSRRVIEQVGFEYLGSLWHRRRFGRDRRWRTIADGTKVV